MASINESIPKTMYTEFETRFNLDTLEQAGLGAEKIASIRTIAQSVGCLTLDRYFKQRKQEEDPWILTPTFLSSHPRLEDFLKKRHRVTHLGNVAFKSELSLGLGTAFLIGRDLLLTAAHCIYRKDAPTEECNPRPDLIVFDFAQNNDKKYDYPEISPSNPPVISFEHKDVYKIKSVLAYELTSGAKGKDWAVIQLDREVIGRQPLEINFSPNLKLQQKVCMLGHPMGLPMKWTKDATVKKLSSELRGEDYFESNLAAFESNSGSPIFFDDGSKKVVGMLCYGHTDYVEDAKGDLIESVRLESMVNLRGFEYLLKTTALSYIEGVLSSINLPTLDLPTNQEKPNYLPGISLEGVCKREQCGTVIYHIGFKIIEELGEIAVGAKCPNCSDKLPWRSINHMILAHCAYEIEGMNEESSKIIKGAFKVMPLDENGGFLRFNIQKWHYITLKVQQLG